MKRKLSIILVALLTVFAFSFRVDAKNEMVDYLVEQKIVEGDGSGDLKLESPIDRASFAKIVVYAIDEVELAEKLKPAPSIFKDMKAGGWANGFANVAATKQIVNGYPGNLFAPKDNVTYEQAIKMLAVVANGGELEKQEKAPGATWATPYIEKATELGILKHLNVNDYKADAKREDVFNMLYEVLQLKHPTVSLKIRGLVQEISEKGAVINVINPGDAKNLKKADIQAFKFAKSINPIDYLGQVVDFNVDENNEVTEVKPAKEYELFSGNFTIGKDGSLYMNNEKRGYVIDESEKSDDRLLNIVHNGVNYSLSKFRAEVKDKVDFAVVTVHNSKVVFIQSFNFKDVLPVVDFKGNTVYVVKDNAPGQKAVANIKSALIFEKGKLKSFDPNRISVDSVLHVYDDGKVIVTEEKLVNVKFKLLNGEIVIGEQKYPLSNMDNFRAVLNVGTDLYDVIVPTKAQPTLIEMGNQKNVIAIDLLGNVQLVRGDLSQKEEAMVVDAITATQIRLRDKTNRLVEVTDSLKIDIKDGNRMVKLTDLNVNDLVYVFSNNDGVTKIAKVASPSEFKNVDKKDGKFEINLRPTRGRYELIKVDGKEYELTDKSIVLVKKDSKFEYTTLEQISKSNPKKDLKAFVITTKDFEKVNSGVKLPVSASDDLVFAIMFDNYEEVQNVKEYKTVKMLYGFEQAIDKEIVATDVNEERKTFSVFKNATIQKLNPGEIVKLSIGEDGTVVAAETQITSDQRVYVIKSVFVKDKITTLEFEREDTKEQFKKVLDRDAVVFGELKEGARMHMFVSYLTDDIDTIEILK